MRVITRLCFFPAPRIPNAPLRYFQGRNGLLNFLSRKRERERKVYYTFHVVRRDVKFERSRFCRIIHWWKMCECGDECVEDTKTRKSRDVLWYVSLGPQKTLGWILRGSFSGRGKFFDEIKFRTPEMATLGLSKVFILDKYFTELQKFWETEKKLQGTKLQSDSILLLILNRSRIFLFSFLKSL